MDSGKHHGQLVSADFINVSWDNFVEQVLATLEQCLACLLLLTLLLVKLYLVLLEHRLADDPGEQGDHAEAAKYDEDHEKDRDDRELTQAAVVFEEVWLHHELEEREHRLGDSAIFV